MDAFGCIAPPPSQQRVVQCPGQALETHCPKIHDLGWIHGSSLEKAPKAEQNSWEWNVQGED